MLRITVILLLAALVFGCSPLVGQSVTSSVQGIVTDSSGAVVPHATCKLTNQATNVVAATGQSIGDGAFRLANVPPGDYTLTIEAAGFKLLTIMDIEVTAAAARALGRLSLQVGEVRDTVSVTAQTAELQLASSERSGQVSGTQLNNIAIRGRDLFAFMSTIPGVVNTKSGGWDSTDPTNSNGSVSMNGNRTSSKNVSMDGVTILDTGNNTGLHFEPNMDAVSEMKVLATNFQAEYGRMGGGQILLITKSGGSSFHGSAYDYYRHEGLNANDFFNNRSGTPISPYRYRISGYSVGGPVYWPRKFNSDRNKLFFFFSQELTGIKLSFGQRLVNTPTALERLGDFSQSATIINDPSTGMAFPGNMIPKDRINANTQTMLNTLPLPNYHDPAFPTSWNYKVSSSIPYPKRQELYKFDYNPTSSLRASYRLVNARDDQKPYYGVWMAPANYDMAPILFSQPASGSVINVVKTFSSTFVSETLFGWDRNGVTIDAADKKLVSSARFGNLPQWYQDIAGIEVDPSYMPNISFGTTPLNTINPTATYMPWHNVNRNYDFSENVTKVSGAHQIKFGAYISKVNKSDPTGNYRGAYNFGVTSLNPFDSGNGFANAVLGNFQTYAEANHPVLNLTHMWNAEFFLQDNWHVSSRLTLDIGLRFYHWTVPAQSPGERYQATFVPSLYDPKKVAVLYRPGFDATGKRVAVDPTTGALAPQANIGRLVPGVGDPFNGLVVGGSSPLVPAGIEIFPKLNYSPRFGFAYDVFGNGKTALRGGFGRFFDRVTTGMNLTMGGNAPSVVTSTAYYGNVATLLQSGGLLAPQNITSGLGNIHLPSVMNFSLGVQQQLFGGVLDASYVGNLTRHLYATRMFNPIPLYSRLNPNNQDPTKPGTPMLDDFLRPIQGFGNINYYSPMATSNYNSLQVGFNRRYKAGLQFGIAYTFSKSLGLNSGFSTSPDVNPYFDYRHYDYGPLSFDRRQNLVFNYVYDMPKVGKRLRSKAVSWGLDNWQLAGISSFITGAPLNIGVATTNNADITGSAVTPRGADVIGNPTDFSTLSTGQTASGLFGSFNPNAWGRPALRTFGNATRGVVYGPGMNNWDVNMSKTVPLGSEQRFIRIRVELFNLFNHTQFGGVNTTALFDASGKQTDPNFGAYTSTLGARIIQLSARLSF